MSRIGSWLTVALMSLAACSSATEEGRKDNFECGVPTGDDRSKAAYCDGANEKCICATRRCAVPVRSGSNECAGSGYAYRFEPRDCVDAGDMRTALQRNDHTVFCPDQAPQPPPCGDGTDAGVCGAEQLCLCGVKQGSPQLTHGARRCISRAVTTECPLGWAYSASGECVEGPTSDQSFILRSASDPVCPELELYPSRCGVPGAQGNRACASDQFCLCSLREGASGTLGVSPYTCVRQSVRCLRPNGQPGLEDRDGTCVGVEPTQLVLLRPDEQACPGAAPGDLFPDAGTSADAGGTP
jgi:hypothetical protein